MGCIGQSNVEKRHRLRQAEVARYSADGKQYGARNTSVAALICSGQRQVNDRGLTMGLFGKKKDSAAGQDNGSVSVALSDGSSVAVTATVDCIGDSCPRPQLMTRKAVGSAGAGDVVAVLIDNPTSMEAIPPMCPEIGATHLETLRQDRGWQVLVRKD